LDSFLVAPLQVLFDSVLVVEIVSYRPVNFAQAEGGKIILDLLDRRAAGELAHNGVERHSRASNANRTILP